ncbi:hypothetical protein [Aureivirga sp. CE67]|uniref:hypothetical protein n=1 Tax=Aureivirga sp. CE67 TaxID=1788983 RepID=UPI0018CBD4BF|nr:hypothetical protein [Aureivirga sp. CE67]
MKSIIFLSVGSTFEIILWILAIIIILYVLAKKKSVLNKDKNIPFDDAIVEDANEENKKEEVEIEKNEAEEKSETKEYLESINAPKLNFERIGKSDSENKDDLKELKGIGPVLEKKLNEIGITSFSQIENLKKNDLQLISVLINYPFHKIQGNHWAKQAKDMKKE